MHIICTSQSTVSVPKDQTKLEFPITLYAICVQGRRTQIRQRSPTLIILKTHKNKEQEDLMNAACNVT